MGGRECVRWGVVCGGEMVCVECGVSGCAYVHCVVCGFLTLRDSYVHIYKYIHVPAPPTDAFPFPVRVLLPPVELARHIFVVCYLHM